MGGKLIKILLLSFLFFIPIFFSSASLAAPIKILIIPGHDNKVWGARYGNIKEADMNLVLATQLFDILKKDKRFKVYITRDSLGYTADFANYLSQQADILSFVENAKKEMQTQINNGSFVKKANAPHHAVSEDIALRLYGFNKWANENKINAMIHIHFNSYPLPSKWTIGKYKGFTIYMPDSQFVNSKGSVGLAKSIFSQLHKKYITSTYGNEKGGLIPDQKLIALGANNTLIKSVDSVLIEYGYIYEKIFRNSTTRHQAYTDMANLTATGIKNYFFNTQP